MRFMLSLIVVLSLLAMPLAAQAADLCGVKNCVAFDVDCEKNTPSQSQDNAKADAKGDHCTHCCTFSQMTPPQIDEMRHTSAEQTFGFYSLFMHSHEPHDLLKPPQAA